jgi:hypothetical protein
VEAATVIAFEIFNGGSRQIQVSLVHLPIAVVEEALWRLKLRERCPHPIFPAKRLAPRSIQNLRELHLAIRDVRSIRHQS